MNDQEQVLINYPKYLNIRKLIEIQKIPKNFNKIWEIFFPQDLNVCFSSDQTFCLIIQSSKEREFIIV